MSLLFTLLGRPLATTEAEDQKIGPISGVAVLGLDALSSASYGPEAALTILLPLGAAGLNYVRPITGIILLLLGTLYFSYRQTIAPYPNGGGSYTVAKENLGKHAGLVAAASLLLDYLLNVAVGISAGVAALESAIPALQKHTLAACLVVLAIITLVNLRGVRSAGIAWSVPTYAFIASLLVIIGIGVVKVLQSRGHPVPVAAPPALPAAIAPVSAWILVRSFASGCTAMTGVEAVSNAVPIFSEPRVKNAQLNLTFICFILGILLLGIAYLTHAYHIGALDQRQPGYQTIISQIVETVAGRGVLYYGTIASVLAVLTLSANTSFTGFPRLCRLLAEDYYLPRGFAILGRRLVYTVGVLILAILSALILTAFDGITDRLIPLFAVGAFGAFTLSQAGMVVHWRRQGSHPFNASLFINGIGALTTAAALIVIIIAKFTEGAWITLLVIPGLVAMFKGVRKHYARILSEIRPPIELQICRATPLLVLVPINGWNCVTEHALRFALQISGDVTALHVSTEEEDTSLRKIWGHSVENPAREAGYTPPKLQIIKSPFRQLFQPILDFIDEMKRAHPDRLIAIVIPELVRPRWWEYFLHNYAATALKALILFKGDDRVITIDTPWYLRK